MLSVVMLVVGAGVCSVALRSFRHPALFRAGTFGFVLTSFLAGWLIGGSVWTGLAFALTWFLLPWLLITWNYPFSYGLHQMPNTVLNRATGEKSIPDLIRMHRAFLEREGGAGICPMVESSLRSELQDDLRGQLEHNLACGILKRAGSSTICYTVRGMFFLWFQFLRDFVRFS
ncbi:MAG: hypothetical protein NTV93_12490 [Verrucomicrobia bacterium]|nr:hypothetical protein [Verrucomicrobiota bacterium]